MVDGLHDPARREHTPRRLFAGPTSSDGAAPLEPYRSSRSRKPLCLSSRLNKRNLIDLFQRSNPISHSIQGRITQKRHPLISSLLPNLAPRLLRQQHLANLVIQLQQLMNRRTPAISRSAALNTPSPFAKIERTPLGRIQPARQQIRLSVVHILHAE